MKKFLMILFVLIGLSVFSNVLEDLYNWLYFDGEGELFELYNNMSYIEVIYETKGKSDDTSNMLSGLSYMNLLSMEKAAEKFSKVSGKFKECAEFLKLRSEVIYRRDKILAKKYLSMLGDSLAERSESAFIKYWVFGEDTSKELGKIFQKALEEFNSKNIGFIDLYAFNYALALKDKNIDEAIKVLNKAVTYKFDIDSVEVYYAVDDLRKSHFANLSLLSLLLQKKAIKETKKLFGLDINVFLSLEQSKRDNLINEKLLNDEESKKLRYINYLLSYSINILVYGKNNYYKLMHFDGKPFIYKGTIKEEQDFSRKLLGIVKTS